MRIGGARSMRALRVQHNVELFKYVAKNITHIPVRGKKAAIIFEVVL